MIWLHLFVSAIIFSVTDIQHHKIRRTHLLLACTFFLPFLTFSSVQHSLINYCGYRLLYHLTRGAIGYGDVRLAALIGLYSGSLFNSTHYLIFINLISLLIAGCCAITLRIIDRRSFRERIPFAPFMFLGLIFSLVLCN